jgi:hypothetical protein
MIWNNAISRWIRVLSGRSALPCALPQSGPLEIFLPKGSVWRPAGSNRRVEIRCLQGTLWVTESGDGRDYILEIRQPFRASGSGMVAVQALRDSRFSVTSIG